MVKLEMQYRLASLVCLPVFLLDNSRASAQFLGVTLSVKSVSSGCISYTHFLSTLVCILANLI